MRFLCTFFDFVCTKHAFTYKSKHRILFRFLFLLDNFHGTIRIFLEMLSTIYYHEWGHKVAKMPLLDYPKAEVLKVPVEIS